MDAIAKLLESLATPVETARAITEIYRPSLEANVHDKLDNFWVLCLCDAVRTFGSESDRQKLLDLLDEIAKQFDVKGSDGAIQMTTAGKVYWRDLPHWQFNLCEYGLCMLLLSFTSVPWLAISQFWVWRRNTT
jgi:hypothetical protein